MESLQRQCGGPGPHTSQDTPLSRWVPSAHLGILNVQQDTMVHAVGRVPPGFLLTACDGRLSPELTWESPPDIAESQHQP